MGLWGSKLDRQDLQACRPVSGYGSLGIVSHASFGSNFLQKFFKKEDQLNKNEYCEWWSGEIWGWHFCLLIDISDCPWVLLHCWLGVRKSIRPVKIEWWGVSVVICLERGADCLHMVQLMPLHPKTPSSLASFKCRLVLPFWYWLTQVVLEKRC